MSESIALRRSPKPGAFTATTLSRPRILFTTSVERASPSTSSATTTNGFLVWATFSSSGRKSAIEEILPAYSRMYASSVAASIRSGSVTKYGEM